MTTYYGYICPQDGYLHIVPANQDVLVSGAAIEVQCESCDGDWHRCHPIPWPWRDAELSKEDKT